MPEAEVPLLRRVDLIALRPDATRAEITGLCARAHAGGCLAICVPGSRVAPAVHALEESSVKVAALVGFPFGTADADVKRYELEAALDAGAREFDVVLHPGLLKEGADKALLRELRDLREAAEERPLKVIVESGLFSPEELRRAVALVIEAEAQFLVTATGCSGRAATPADIRFFREAAGPELGLKAVGGVSGPEAARALIEAGANRVGVFDLAAFTPAA
ncbi:MAG: deoxyribose-phosphate aldolase [Limisphaerales bacterium]